MSARLETLRLARSRRPLVAAGALALFLVLMLVGFYTYAQSRTGGTAEFHYTFENSSYFNGLTFALYAFYFGFVLLLPIFAATEGGAQLAGDTGAGTLSLYLTRPVSKARIFFTRFFVAAGYTTLLTGAFLAIGLVLGLVLVGWGELRLYPGVLQMTDRPQRLAQDVALVRFALTWPTASLTLLAPLAFSFWIASHLRSAVNAVSTAAALYIVLYLIAEVHFFADLRPWLFTSHAAAWRELFQEQPDLAVLGRHVSASLGFTCVFLALGFGRFRRREEHGA
jgi:ABC-type transport system involved in multi-copper enzyme maturation permease subunit